MFRGQKRDDTTLEQLVLQAQAGDEQIRHRLIEDYQPFIATSVSRVCKRYIDQEQDDEFSIGLIAFNEAIDSFHEGKGSSFFTFARLVISRKVIDYIRQQKHHRQTVPLEYSGQSNEAYTEEKAFLNSQRINLSKASMLGTARLKLKNIMRNYRNISYLLRNW